jgi:deoxyribose-phosphate aldolase
MKKPTARQIAGIIDHTLLKPDATLGQISQLCREARDNGFAAVCVNPFYIPQVHTLLKGSDVKPCAVVGFPLGSSRSSDKVSEARSVLSAGIRTYADACAMIEAGATRIGTSAGLSIIKEALAAK